MVVTDLAEKMLRVAEENAARRGLKNVEAEVFRQAGLRNVTETEVSVPVAFDEPAEYFTFMNEVAAPVVAGMAKADEAARARIRDTVIRLAAAQKTNGKVRLGGTALVVTGEK